MQTNMPTKFHENHSFEYSGNVNSPRGKTITHSLDSTELRTKGLESYITEKTTIHIIGRPTNRSSVCIQANFLPTIYLLLLWKVCFHLFAENFPLTPLYESHRFSNIAENNCVLF